MISNDTKFGYEKILGLSGDRTKKRSLEARADAFSRLKNTTENSCWWDCIKMYKLMQIPPLTQKRDPQW